MRKVSQRVMRRSMSINITIVAHTSLQHNRLHADILYSSAKIFFSFSFFPLFFFFLLESRSITVNCCILEDLCCLLTRHIFSTGYVLKQEELDNLEGITENTHSMPPGNKLC